MGKATSTRVTNVQVPGESNPAQDDGAEDQSQDPETAAVTESAEAKAVPAKAAAPAKASKAEAKAVDRLTRPSRSEYKHMRAEDIDASKLTSAVLSLDGWVCPPTLTAPKQG